MFSNNNKTLPEQAASRIVDYIIENDLQSGDKIGNEYDLAQRLGVGRSTLREAVRILVSKNVLEIKRGTGTYVADNTGVVNDPLGLTFEKDKFKLAKDLLQFRIILEPEVASIAANVATEEDIEKINEQCDIVEKLILEGTDHTKEDIKFHEAIAKCAGNLIIEKLIPIINTSVVVFSDITAKQLTIETIQTHRAVADAIANHNSADARDAMIMHLLFNKRRINEIIKKRKKKTEAK